MRRSDSFVKFDYFSCISPPARCCLKDSKKIETIGSSMWKTREASECMCARILGGFIIIIINIIAAAAVVVGIVYFDLSFISYLYILIHSAPTVSCCNNNNFLKTLFKRTLRIQIIYFISRNSCCKQSDVASSSLQNKRLLSSSPTVPPTSTTCACECFT